MPRHQLVLRGGGLPPQPSPAPCGSTAAILRTVPTLQERWKGGIAPRRVNGALQPAALGSLGPAAGAVFSSLLQLASFPECFGKALTSDPQYKLSPARGREKLLPDLQAPGFTSCLQ